MKINYYLFLFLMIFSGTVFGGEELCSCTDFSHSYFAVRPQFQIGSPEYTSLARSFRYARQDGYGVGLQAVVFGGRSTNTKDLGTFFSPRCHPCFIVDGAVKVNSEDLMAQHFNLFSVTDSPVFDMSVPTVVMPLDTAFRSKVTFKPEQSVVGLGLVYQHEFCAFEMPHWVSVSAPIIRVQNTMGLCEEIKQQGDFFDVQPLANEHTNLNKSLRSMKEALVQDCWDFGKIDNKKRHKTRLAFIQVQVGEVWVDTDCCHFEPYVGITIPTGNKPKAEYVFEPIAGNGDHVGILWGASGGVSVWQDDCRDLTIDFEGEVTMQYLLSKTHKRSVDLVNKPWSRYIEVYANSQQAAQAITLSQQGNPVAVLQSIFLASPGINVLTLDLKVDPGFNFTSNLAFVLAHCPYDSGFDAELGYNFYARQHECLSLKKPFKTKAAIKDHIGMSVTSPVRDMTGDLLLNEASVRNLMANGQFNPAGIAAAYDRGIIREADLNLASAAHPCMIAHTVYGAFGYHSNVWCYPVMASLGGSYEFNRKHNSTMDRWLIWGKLGVSF